MENAIRATDKDIQLIAKELGFVQEALDNGTVELEDVKIYADKYVGADAIKQLLEADLKDKWTKEHEDTFTTLEEATFKDLVESDVLYDIMQEFNNETNVHLVLNIEDVSLLMFWDIEFADVEVHGHG